VLVDGATVIVNPDLGQALIAVALGFIGFMVQGPSEEVLFRGYVLENVREKWGETWAVWVSAVTFSLLHVPNPAFGLLPFINLALFGLAMALYRLHVDRNQLWGVFAIHAVWNWLQQVVFGLPNSGVASPVAETLFRIHPNTSLPDPFWGGGFGPEGTLGATIVLGALIVGIVRPRRKAQPRTQAKRI
jgi:membrane protease YdiL (CAAX protease family)